MLFQNLAEKALRDELLTRDEARNLGNAARTALANARAAEFVRLLDAGIATKRAVHQLGISYRTGTRYRRRAQT